MREQYDPPTDTTLMSELKNQHNAPMIQPARKGWVSPLKKVELQLKPGGLGRTKAEKESAKKLIQGVVKDAVEREMLQANSPDFTIAIHIQPKKKGWAWDRKTGIPVTFAHPSQTMALINWASRQPWWLEPSSDTDDRTPLMLYTELCMEYAETNALGYKTAQAVRDFITRCLNNLKDKAKSEPAVT